MSDGHQWAGTGAPTGLGRLVASEVRANRHNPRLALAVALFRLASTARGEGARPRSVAIPLIVFYKLVVEWGLGIEIPVSVRVGPGLRIYHGYGIVIHQQVRIGANVVLKQGVTLGHRGEENDPGPVPTIGDDVVFGPGAQVLGGVTVGDGARVGAGAIVLRDVPPGALAVGNPARIIERG
jgi:serine O-acetyltransferase/putative colanic acid biosynthesis acetyltransferase WcaB